MQKILIVLWAPEDHDAFVAFLRGEGLWFDEKPFLPQIVETENTPAIRTHPLVASWEPSDTPMGLGAGAIQSLSIPADRFNAPNGVGAPAFMDNWGLHRITRRANGAIRSLPRDSWFYATRQGEGVDYYIIDTGVTTNHEDFEGRATFVGTYAGTPNVDLVGHGTHCASSGVGKRFGAAKKAEVRAFKGLGDDGSGTAASLVNACNAVVADYASRAGLNRPASLNMSLTGGYSVSSEAALNAIIDAGIVVCAAAGNSSLDTGAAGVDIWPGEYTDVICVGGLAMDDMMYEKAGSGSNWGVRLDILAPGEDIRAAWGSGYGTLSGTSMGCGMMNGIVCCMLEGYNRLTSRAQVEAVRQYVIDQATTTAAVDLVRFPGTPNRIAYLDPSAHSAAIPGLTKKV